MPIRLSTASALRDTHERRASELHRSVLGQVTRHDERRQDELRDAVPDGVAGSTTSLDHRQSMAMENAA